MQLRGDHGRGFHPIGGEDGGGGRGVSLISMAKSSFDFFRPQCVAAKVKPCGTSALDSRVVMVCRSAGRNRGRGFGEDGHGNAFGNYRGDHGNKFAGALLRAGAAITLDFFGERLARGCGKSLAFEKLWSVRDGENAGDAAAASLCEG